ncbi:DUF3034 family protein [Marinobacter mangrovi]|uniref:DUF3034 family protein n=1 Tax=Marinobacter mangrovi TaxID=2803918 RepID=UPI002E2BF095|nr:DUF3034 family protein [Marinobacter mangrovi]
MPFTRFLPWLLVALASAPPAVAEPGSRLWATGGVTTIEGAAGGGLVPMAVLTGYASDREWGGSVALSHAPLDDYTVDVVAGALNWHNRIEISAARQTLDLDTLGAALNQDDLQQDILGAKLRLTGDVLYSPYGQWSLGVQYKHNRTFTVPDAVGARDVRGTDVYLAGTKVFLAGLFGRNVLVNGVVRGTKANQGGLLGFGGDKNDSYDAVLEGSAGVFIDRQWLVGTEYRQKPDNLGFAREEDGYDLFVAWVPERHLAVTAAWVNLGSIAGLDDQQGAYLSLQGSF